MQLNLGQFQHFAALVDRAIEKADQDRNAIEVSPQVFWQPVSVASGQALSSNVASSATVGAAGKLFSTGNLSGSGGFWPNAQSQFVDSAAVILGFGYLANLAHPFSGAQVYAGARMTFGAPGGGIQDINNVPLNQFPSGAGAYGMSDTGPTAQTVQPLLSLNGIPALPSRYNLASPIVVAWNKPFFYGIDMDATTLAPTTTVSCVAFMYTLWARPVKT
jgi:hypothetical protein